MSREVKKKKDAPNFEKVKMPPADSGLLNV
jgi:hypothetical protein